MFQIIGSIVYNIGIIATVIGVSLYIYGTFVENSSTCVICGKSSPCLSNDKNCVPVTILGKINEILCKIIS